MKSKKQPVSLISNEQNLILVGMDENIAVMKDYVTLTEIMTKQQESHIELLKDYCNLSAKANVLESFADHILTESQSRELKEIVKKYSFKETFNSETEFDKEEFEKKTGKFASEIFEFARKVKTSIKNENLTEESFKENQRN